MKQRTTNTYIDVDIPPHIMIIMPLSYFFQRLGDEMPVSLQNNLSELDTLLADLNNAK